VRQRADYSVILIETIRDDEFRRKNPNTFNTDPQLVRMDLFLHIAGVTAHEIGHAPGGQSGGTDHLEKGILTEGYTTLGAQLGIGPVNLLGAAGDPYITAGFEPITVKRFRKARYWSDWTSD
jgi:hypothetical protein